MTVVLWSNEKVTRERESVTSLGAITSLKQMELKEDNFLKVPDTVMIADILQGESVKASKPSDKVPEYANIPEAQRPFDKVTVIAEDYGELLKINELFKDNPVAAQAMLDSYKRFKFFVRYDLKGVEQFSEVIKHARQNASKKKIANPALVLKGCQFAFIPQWDMNKGNHSGVEVVLKSFDRAEVIEQVAPNTPAKEKSAVQELSSVFD